MRLIAPIILLLHWMGMFTYFTVIKYYPECSQQYGWSVFYFSVNNLTIINYCLMFVFIPKRKLGAHVDQFVLIDIAFTLILAFTTLFHYKHLIKYTYGFQLSVLGMIIITIMIILTGKRHGLFKN